MTNTLNTLCGVKNIIPLPMYWLDINQRYLGLNSLALQLMGITPNRRSFDRVTPYKIFLKQ